MNPQALGQLIFDKGGKNIQWNKDSLFSKWCWENWTAGCKTMKLGHSLTPYTKINSKWIKDLNIRQDTINLLEDNIGKTLSDIYLKNFLLEEIKARINKWGLTKLTNFCTAKETISKTKQKYKEWEKIFANAETNKGLISRICKQIIRHNKKKPTAQFKNGQKI